MGIIAMGMGDAPKGFSDHRGGAGARGRAGPGARRTPAGAIGCQQALGCPRRGPESDFHAMEFSTETIFYASSSEGTLPTDEGVPDSEGGGRAEPRGPRPGALLEEDVLLEAVERMGFGLFMADPDDELRMVYANPWLEAKVGRDREVFCRTDRLLDLVHPRDDGTLSKAVLDVLRGGTGISIAEVGLLGPGDAVTPMVVSLTLVEREGGRHLIGVCTDLSERTAALKAVAQERERTEHYLSVVAMDVFNMMQGAMLNLDQAAASASDPSVVRARITKGVSFMRSSTQLVAALRKSMSGPARQGEDAPVDIARALREQTDMLKVVYSARQLRFALDLPKGPAPTWGGKRAEEAIFNVLLWSARTDPPKALRAVSLKEPASSGGRWALTVCVLPHPWRQDPDPRPSPAPESEARARETEGLAIACQMMDELGGRGWLEEGPAEGDLRAWRCGLELPLARPRALTPGPGPPRHSRPR